MICLEVFYFMLLTLGTLSELGLIVGCALQVTVVTVTVTLLHHID